MNEQTITLDLDKRPSIVPVLYIRQGDKSGTQLKVDITKDGSAFALGSYGVKFCLRAPKGKGYYEVDGTASGNRATFTIDETYAGNYAGTTDTAYVEILEGANVIASTANFRVVILQSAEDGADPNGAWKSGITEAVEAANAAVARADAAAAAVEDATEAATQAAADASAAADAAEAAAAGVDDATAAARAAASSAQASSSTASAAASAANAAATIANEAADNATDMLIEVSDVTARAEQAIAGMGDISELAVPLMTEDVRGGAKVGQGLHVEDGSLSLGPLVQTGNPTHGCALYGVDAQGWAEQASTTGKNLLPNTATSQTINGVTFTVNADGSVTANGTASADANIVVGTREGLLLGETYTIAGCPSGGSSSTYGIIIANPSWMYETGSGLTFVANSTTTTSIRIVVKSGNTVSNLTFYPQIEAGSTATEYEPYSGAAPSPSPEYPQAIEVCRGRNLLDASIFAPSSSYYEVADDGTLTVKASDGRSWASVTKVQLAAGTYTVSRSNASGTIKIRTSIDDYAADYLQVNAGVASATFALSQDCDCAFKVGGSASSYPFTTTLQIESGSTPTPYVPYGHVGLEVTYDGTTTVMPIPLPSKGWAGGLPDGTADALSVDSAGKWEWMCPTAEKVYDGSSDEAWSVSGGVAYTVLDDSPAPKAGGHRVYSTHYASTPVTSGDTWVDPSIILGTTHMSASAKRLVVKDSANAQSATWAALLAASPMTVLYPLATPTTEHGYIDLPDLPDGAVVSCRELDSVGVKWFVAGAKELVEHAANMARRNEEIEDAIAELAARVAALES